MNRASRAPAAVPGTAHPDLSSLHAIECTARKFAEDDSLDEAVDRGRKRALALAMSAPPDGSVERDALVAFAAEMIVALAPQLAHHDERLRAMIDDVRASADIPWRVLGREVLRAPQLLQLAPPLAVEVLLGLVLAFTQARAITLWARIPDGELEMLTGCGNVHGMPVESHETASSIISGETVLARDDGDLAATQIPCGQNPPAALLLFGEDALSPWRRLLIEAAEPLLALALQRQQPACSQASVGSSAGSSGGDSYQPDAATAAERRLTRLRFDLHDGPQQDILMLAEDLRLLRSQLAQVVDSDRHPHVLGRVDDLEARLIAVDGDLRRISVSVQSPFLHKKSFEDALDTVIEAFTARTGLTPAVHITGDFTALSDSQHITLLGLIREALSNVREHSHATHVSIAVSTRGGAVTASVTDNGCGFDPETMLVRATQNGRLGLVGMHERVRLLGGTTTITSRPGGPTVVSLELPPAPVGTPRHVDK
ncbi:MAG: sensor histidine kinase [Solirubrobacteraceae bacterium]